jgi:hypothetical protein
MILPDTRLPVRISKYGFPRRSCIACIKWGQERLQTIWGVVSLAWYWRLDRYKVPYLQPEHRMISPGSQRAFETRSGHLLCFFDTFAASYTRKCLRTRSDLRT